MGKKQESKESIIRLDWGWPAPELQATRSFAEVLRDVNPRKSFGDALFYGQRAGNYNERESLASALSSAGPTVVHPDTLILSSGAGVALDLILGSHVSGNQVCFTQALTYHNALGIIQERGFTTIPLAETDDGSFDFEKIEEQFRTNPGAMCYLVPVFSNPCGATMSDASREHFVWLAQRYGIVVISDEVYRLLSFEDAPKKSLASLDSSGESVVSLGSLTKLAGPGLRLGWLEFGCATSDSALAERILDSSVVVNGGCLNQFSAWVVGEWIRAGHFLPHLEHVRGVLAGRGEALYKALQRSLESTYFDIHEARGGYFVWLSSRDISVSARFSNLSDCGVGVREAQAFRCDASVTRQGIRLSFSYYDQEALEEAAARIGRALCSTG